MSRTAKEQDLETYTWGNNCEATYLLKDSGLSVIREKMPPGTRELLHCHRKAQQYFYILNGTATMAVDGEEIAIEQGNGLHIPAGALHLIANNSRTDLEFLVTSQPESHGDRVNIIAYSEALREHLRTLNEEWLEKYFKLEDIDVVQLGNPQGEILDKGGHIFYAAVKDDVLGTASLLRINDREYELGKMAVTEKAQGFGLGNILMRHCLQQARKLGIEKLVLYSNTKLAPAIHIYKKFGFGEVPLEPGHYERANIKMQKLL